MNIVNLTPHPIHIVKNGERVLTIPADPEPLRMDEERKICGVEKIFQVKGGHSGELVTTNGDIEVPIMNKQYTLEEELPPRLPGVVYVVPSIIASQIEGRDDLVVPNTIRDNEGNIIGCDSFSVIE